MRRAAGVPEDQCNVRNKRNSTIALIKEAETSAANNDFGIVYPITQELAGVVS